MALQKIPVSVKFTQGLDRSSDEVLTIPTRLQVAKNVEFAAEKSSIQTRNGWLRQITGTTLFAGAPNGAAEAPAATLRRLWKRKTDLAVESDNGLHIAALLDAKWRQVVDSYNRAAVELTGVFHGQGHVVESDIAGTDNVKVIVYTSTEGVGLNGTRVYLMVTRDGTVLRHERISSSSTDAVSPRAVYNSVSQRFYVYWGEQNGAGPGHFVKGLSFTISSLVAGALTATTITSDWTGDGQIDACWHPYTSGGAVFLACPVNATARSLQCFKLAAADGTTISAQANSGTVLATTLTAVRVVPTSLVASSRVGYIAICHASTPANGLGVVVADLDNGAPAAAFTTIAQNPTGKMSVLTDPNNTTNFWLTWEEGTAGSESTRILTTNQRATAFTPTLATTTGFAVASTCLSVGLASDLHVRGRSVYVGTVKYSLEQAAHLEIEIGKTAVAGATHVGNLAVGRGDICARLTFNGAFLRDSTFGGLVKSLWSVNNIGGVSYPAQIPHAVAGSTTTFTTKQRGNGDRIVVQGIDTTPLGLDVAVLTWDTGLNSVEVGESAVLAGACPHFFDGNTLTELGFLCYPEAALVSVTGNNAGGSLADGAYQLVMVYEWVDQQGNKHQSRPSVPVTATVSGGGGNGSITINNLPYLNVTRKQGVVLVVFCTEVNGPIFYRIPVQTGGTPSAYGVANDPATALTGALNTITTLTGINAGEQLYTTGGVLPAGPAPACKHVDVVQRRVWFSGCEEQQILYTEERTQGFFPNTNELYAFETDSELGRVSAIAELDDKVAVFQEKQIGVIVGSGPNRLGQQISFSPILKALSGLGHSWAESNVIAKDTYGIWFRDPERGLRHIGRGLQLTEVPVEDGTMPAGSEVDDLLSSMSGAEKFEGKKQIRFFNGTSVLVWDYENKQWSQFVSASVTNVVHGASLPAFGFFGASLFFLGRVSGEWSVYSEGQSGGGTDQGSTNIVATITTGWLRLGELTGFQRLYSVQVKGQFRSGNSGIVESANGGSLQVFTENNYNVGLDQPGTSSPSFAGAQWLAFAGSDWQLEHKPSVQKGESVRVTVFYTSTGGSRITGISLLVGAKRGMFKTAQSQRF